MTDQERTMSTAPTQIVHADATKDFFVTMITRDILLRDCIFDLLDNSIDGARRMLAPHEHAMPFSGREISLTFDAATFQISDNCGGIQLSDAINYAFHFGKRGGGTSDVKGGIGLYGIGMKRAIFKIGRLCTIRSHASDASFEVTIDVDDWEQRKEWDFEYTNIAPEAVLGTTILISKLNSGVKDMLGDRAFKNELMRDIARDYAFFIQQGLTIKVSGDTIPSYKYEFTKSDQVEPSVEQYQDDGVNVRILAGLVDELPDDIPDELKPDRVDRFGWFVVCNDRVVLAANKGSETVWGDDDFVVWHPQYNGFAGFVFFNADDQRKLPWTTTKRELDAASPLYRRTIDRMKVVTRLFTQYTNARKADLPAARAAEAPVGRVPISALRTFQPLRLPAVGMNASRPDFVNISYKRDKRQVEEIRTHLGALGMSAKDIGIKTFEYYRKVELGK